MKNFSVFMIAFAIACGNFAEAKLTREQVTFLNNNVIGRDFNNPPQNNPNYRDQNHAYVYTWLRPYDQYHDKYSADGQLDTAIILAGRTLAQEVIRSYVNMKYTSGNTNSYSHRQIGNVLAYENVDGKVIVLKNGVFVVPSNGNLVPNSVIESHDNVIGLSVNIIKGIAFALKHKSSDMHVYIENLISNNLDDRNKAMVYFINMYETDTVTADNEYNEILSSYVDAKWKKSFGNDTGKYIHTEAQVAVLYAIYDLLCKKEYLYKNKKNLIDAIQKLLPANKVYSLYDACRSCREIHWVRDKPDDFMCHVYDRQACIGNANNAILKNFTSQETCNIFVENVRASGVPQNTLMRVNGNVLNQVNGQGQRQIPLPVGHNLPDAAGDQLTIVY